MARLKGKRQPWIPEAARWYPLEARMWDVMRDAAQELEAKGWPLPIPERRVMQVAAYCEPEFVTSYVRQCGPGAKYGVEGFTPVAVVVESAIYHTLLTDARRLITKAEVLEYCAEHHMRAAMLWQMDAEDPIGDELERLVHTGRMVHLGGDVYRPEPLTAAQMDVIGKALRLHHATLLVRVNRMQAGEGYFREDGAWCAPGVPDLSKIGHISGDAPDA